MTNDHIIKSYDDELARLLEEIQRMAVMARDQLHAAVRATDSRDIDVARHIIEADDAIDMLEHAIGQDIVRLLALRAPMAGDLRCIFAALRIAGDLERIGDCAAGIARRIPALTTTLPSAPVRALERLTHQATTALDQVMTAWHRHDLDMAWQVWHGDERIDDAYVSLFRELLTYMMEDSRQIGACTQLLFMAKNVERIGDHATNIAESVWFTVTGDPLIATTPRPR